MKTWRRPAASPLTGGRSGCSSSPDLDLLVAGLVPHQLQDLLQDQVEIDLFDGTFRFPAEAEQTVDDPFAAVGFPDDDVQVLREIPRAADRRPSPVRRGSVAAAPRHNRRPRSAGC